MNTKVCSTCNQSIPTDGDKLQEEFERKLARIDELRVQLFTCVEAEGGDQLIIEHGPEKQKSIMKNLTAVEEYLISAFEIFVGEGQAEGYLE